jgi:Fur family ferric uptake transcriptional regulator
LPQIFREWSTVPLTPTTLDFEGMLRAVALRVTRPRIAVLAAVHDHPHTDTDWIICLVRDCLGEVSHQGVYDVLRALTAAGLVRRFQPMGSVARYQARVGDNHHHIVCQSCGAADVDCAVGYAPCLAAADHSGYEVDEAEVIAPHPATRRPSDWSARHRSLATGRRLRSRSVAPPAPESSDIAASYPAQGHDLRDTCLHS